MKIVRSQRDFLSFGRQAISPLAEGVHILSLEESFSEPSWRPDLVICVYLAVGCEAKLVRTNLAQRLIDSVFV